MKKLTAIIFLACGLCPLANADVWKWVDAKGVTHYVETITPIYTWQDEQSKVHYSDKPDHEDAVLVQLVWHSKGRVVDVEENGDTTAGGSRSETVDPNETEIERQLRKEAEAHYCKRATEIYNSYLNAPKLYNNKEDGDKHYLSEEEMQATIAETKATVEESCK